MTNEELNRSSSGDQRDEGLKKYGALSDLFCKTCCAPSLNQEALDEHLKTGCSTGIIRYTESSHFAEGNFIMLYLIILTNLYKRESFKSKLILIFCMFLGELLEV